MRALRRRCVPAAGSCASTVPGSLVGVLGSVTVDLQPGVLELRLRASSLVLPTTSGTVTCCGPRETTSVTVRARARAACPRPASVSITVPLATVSRVLLAHVDLEAGVLQLLLGLVAAASRARTGPSPSPGPPETMIVTVEPSSASCAGCGSWRGHAVRAARRRSARSRRSTSKPAFWRICAAVAERRARPRRAPSTFLRREQQVGADRRSPTSASSSEQPPQPAQVAAVGRPRARPPRPAARVGAGVRRDPRVLAGRRRDAARLLERGDELVGVVEAAAPGPSRSARITTASSAGGDRRVAAATGGTGSSETCLSAIVTGDSASNGTRPVSSS